jgi:hypothetical protein
MKGKLCRLTKLFVTGSPSWGPMGWGFWEGPYRLPGSKSVYVGIAERELTGKKTFLDVENQTMRDLLQSPDQQTKGPGLVELKTGADLDLELTVLAELAHELGHAMVADANMDGIKRYHPRRKYSGPPRSLCFQDAFIRSSWDEDRFNQNLRLWVDFGNQYNNRPKNHSLRFSLARLRSAVSQGNFETANRAIKNAYDSGEFVSFASIINGWEDIVETFKYKVLADVMTNQKVGFSLDGRDVNVFDRLGSGVLEKKVKCLRDIGFLSGQP